ncbi:MAG: hypothetical protein ACYDD4_04985 [Acidimicrobiales bacterium]
MHDITSVTEQRVLDLVTRTIAFVDTEAAFGPEHPRTVVSKARLAAMTMAFCTEDEDAVTAFVRGRDALGATA